MFSFTIATSWENTASWIIFDEEILIYQAKKYNENFTNLKKITFSLT